MSQLLGTVISAQITTGDTANTFSIGDTNLMQGGQHSVTTIEERDAITTERRREGMTCWVAGTVNTAYRLTGGTLNYNWHEVTTAGTTTLAALSDVSIPSPETNQVLTYNGSLWVASDPTSTVAPGAFTFYPDDIASGTNGYFNLSTAPSGQAENQDAVTVGGATPFATVESYISTYLNRTSVEGGLWEFNSFATVANAARPANVVTDIYTRAINGSETYRFSGTAGPINTTSPTLYTVIVAQGSFAVSATDKLVARYSFQRSTAPSTTATFYHSGSNHASHIHTPLGYSHNNLVGLQGGNPSTEEYYHVTESQFEALVGSSGSASASNPYVTSSDSRLDISVISYGADSSGTLDSTSAFAAAIAAAPAGSTVRVPSGTYRADVAIYNKSVRLVGDVGTTLIPVSATSGAVYVEGGVSATHIPLTAAANEWDSTGTVASTAGLAVGDYVRIGDATDRAYTLNVAPNIEFNRIVGLTGTTFTTSNRFISSYSISGTNAAYVAKVTYPVDFKIENIKIAIPAGMTCGGVVAFDCVSVTMDNVSVSGADNYGSHAVLRCSNVRIINCYGRDGQNTGTGGHGYGYSILRSSHDVLIDGYISENVRECGIAGGPRNFTCINGLHTNHKDNGINTHSGGCKRGLIANNTIVNPTSIGLNCGFASTSAATGIDFDIQFVNNTVINAGVWGIYCTGYDASLSCTRIRFVGTVLDGWNKAVTSAPAIYLENIKDFEFLDTTFKNQDDAQVLQIINATNCTRVQFRQSKIENVYSTSGGASGLSTSNILLTACTDMDFYGLDYLTQINPWRLIKTYNCQRVNFNDVVVQSHIGASANSWLFAVEQNCSDITFRRVSVRSTTSTGRVFQARFFCSNLNILDSEITNAPGAYFIEVPGINGLRVENTRFYNGLSSAFEWFRDSGTVTSGTILFRNCRIEKTITGGSSILLNFLTGNQPQIENSVVGSMIQNTDYTVTKGDADFTAWPMECEVYDVTSALTVNRTATLDKTTVTNIPKNCRIRIKKSAVGTGALAIRTGATGTIIATIPAAQTGYVDTIWRSTDWYVSYPSVQTGTDAFAAVSSLAGAAYTLAMVGTNTGTAALNAVSAEQGTRASTDQNLQNQIDSLMSSFGIGFSGTFALYMGQTYGGPSDIQVNVINGVVVSQTQSYFAFDDFSRYSAGTTTPGNTIIYGSSWAAYGSIFTTTGTGVIAEDYQNYTSGTVIGTGTLTGGTGWLSAVTLYSR